MTFIDILIVTINEALSFVKEYKEIQGEVIFSKVKQVGVLTEGRIYQYQNNRAQYKQGEVNSIKICAFSQERQYLSRFEAGTTLMSPKYSAHAF